MNVYIPVVGQFTNIGDTLHRKILISWFKEEDITLHIYVGKANNSFVDALHIRETDVIYTSLMSWVFSIVFKNFFKKTYLIFNPGEMTFSSKRLNREFFLMFVQLYIKLFNGKIIRPGVAVKSDIKVKNLGLWKLILKLSHKIYWRTCKSKELFKKGEIIPDLAFYNTKNEIDFESKDKLVISMRGDKTPPSEKWYEGVQDFASTHNLQIIICSQVKLDNEQTELIANKLKANSFTWKEKYSHDEQEGIVNKIYLESKIVISDRLHVLISAFTKGAIPVNIPTVHSNKIQDHFDVLQIENVSLKKYESAKHISSFLESKLNQGFDIEKMNWAKIKLKETREEILSIIKL